MKVAIKILEKEKIKDSSDTERVSREIKILKLVKHAHIVQLYEIIETSKELYLIMELAEGGELFDYIVSRSKLKEPEACRFLSQILQGVEYLQKVMVVHRDLKPENLLIDSHKSIKIVDFGLSNTYKPGETLKTACGSPCYAAPEMIAGKRYHGATVDIWSCGVILFAMICGYLPFEDPNTSLLYKKILTADYKCAKWVSSEGQDLLKKILNTDPEKRFTIEMIKNHPWYLNNLQRSEVSESCQVSIQEEVVKGVENLGIERSALIESLNLGKFNHATATYWLMLKKIQASKPKVPYPPAKTPDFVLRNGRKSELQEGTGGSFGKEPEIMKIYGNIIRDMRPKQVARTRIYAKSHSPNPPAEPRPSTSMGNHVPVQPNYAKPINEHRNLRKGYVESRRYRVTHREQPAANFMNSLNCSLQDKPVRTGTSVSGSRRKVESFEHSFRF